MTRRVRNDRAETGVHRHFPVAPAFGWWSAADGVHVLQAREHPSESCRRLSAGSEQDAYLFLFSSCSLSGRESSSVKDKPVSAVDAKSSAVRVNIATRFRNPVKRDSRFWAGYPRDRKILRQQGAVFPQGPERPFFERRAENRRFTRVVVAVCVFSATCLIFIVTGLS